MSYTNLDQAICTDELMGDLIDEDPALGALWMLLLGASQPWGRFPANIKRLKAEVCPMVDRFTGDALQSLVDRLVAAGRLVKYTCYRTDTPCIAIKHHARYNGRGRQYHRFGDPTWSPEPDWEPHEALLSYLQAVRNGKFRGKKFHDECEKFGVCPLVVPGSAPTDHSLGTLPNARGDVETLRGREVEKDVREGAVLGRGGETSEQSDETHQGDDTTAPPKREPAALDIDFDGHDHGTAQPLPREAQDPHPEDHGGATPEDLGHVLGNHPSINAAVNRLLPRWPQSKRQQLAYAVSVACEDPNTDCTEPEVLAALEASPPGMEYEPFPRDWLRDWLKHRAWDKRRDAQARASPTGRRTQAPTPAEDLGPSRAVKL